MKGMVKEQMELPMESPIALSRRETRARRYQPEPLIARLNELLERHNESMREAALRAGLDHQAVRRVMEGQRPTMPVCILLADHFDVNPNEILQLAGWPELKAFGTRSIRGMDLPVEAVEVAFSIANISDPRQRKKKAQAIMSLLAE